DGTHHGRSSQEVLRIGGLVLADHRPGSTLLMRGILMSSSIREYPVITGALASAIGLTSAVIGLTLSGCATQRVTGPDVMALPSQGEAFEAFEQHDVTCRQYATAQIGGQSPGQVATASGITGAAAGTGIGAAAGALLGSASGHAGTGAAIGAGTGLLAGGLL